MQAPNRSSARSAYLSFPLLCEEDKDVSNKFACLFKESYKVFVALSLLWINISVQVVTWCLEMS